MNDSQITRTREQLEFVKAILVTTVEADNPSINRERVILAIERIALIEELLSEVSQEVDKIRSHNEEIRRERRIESIIQKESLQRREAGNPPSTNASHGDSVVRSERQYLSDQGLIDSYSDLARKYGELSRSIQLIRGDVESAIRNIDDFWTGDEEAKRFVMEKLRAAVIMK